MNENTAKTTILNFLINRLGFEHPMVVLYAENMDKYDEKTCHQMGVDILIGRDPRKEEYWIKPDAVYETKEQIIARIEELKDAKWLLWMKDIFDERDWQTSYAYDEEIRKLAKELEKF